jgi:hypothetical protein
MTRVLCRRSHAPSDPTIESTMALVPSAALFTFALSFSAKALAKCCQDIQSVKSKTAH